MYERYVRYNKEADDILSYIIYDYFTTVIKVLVKTVAYSSFAWVL